MTDKPTCYGKYWEGVEGSDCTKIDEETGKKGCGVLDDCLAKFATGDLIGYQKQLGEEKATPEALGSLASVAPEAILLAINFQNNAGINPFVVKPPQDLRQPVEAPLPVEEESPSEEAEEGPEEATEDEPEEGSKEEKEEGQAEEGKAEAAGKTKVKKKTKKKKTKKKDKKKTKKKRGRPKKKATKKKATKKAREADTIEVSDPPKAAPVKSAKAAVETQTAQSVKNVSAQVGGLRIWGDKAQQKRWLRERQRSKAIAMLTPGMKLTRLSSGEGWKYPGETLTVIVRQGYYQFKDKKWPTLYSIVKEVVGTRPVRKQKKRDGTRPEGTREMVPWSAPRFFRLYWLLEVKKR